MRLLVKSGAVVAASAGLLLAAPSVAFAAEESEVSYAYTVSGSTVTNTITNDSGTPLRCSTSLAPAPDGVLPPIAELGGQDLFDGGVIDPGVTTQTIADVPDGSWVVLATCGRDGDDAAMWVSDYPGIGDILALYPNPSFAVEQASTLLTLPLVEPEPEPLPVPDPEPTPEPTLLESLPALAASILAGLGAIFGS
ncbi:MAG: hypothetical protein WBF79_05155 [Rhodococcus sp. (in: high G+C Gram-positive bacteria)]